MNLRETLAVHRPLPGKRWINIALRTLHLIGVAGIGSAYLFGVAAEAWLHYLWLAIASGVAMVAVEVWWSGAWLVEVRGVVILAKLLLLGSIGLLPALAAPLFVLVIVISAVGAHAPARLRHYSLLHGREMDEGHRRRRPHTADSTK